MNTRPWIHVIPNSNFRNQFQTILTDLSSLYDEECKPKNAMYFSNVADICEMFLKALDKETPPADVEIAGLFNTLNTQLNMIDSKKEGQHHQHQIGKIRQELTGKIAKFSSALTDGMKQYPGYVKAEAEKKSDKPNSASTPVIRQALTNFASSYELTVIIEKLRMASDDKTRTYKRMAKRHPYLTFGGITSAVLGFGGILQSGVNSAFNIACEAQGEALDVAKDPRYILPTLLLVFAAAGLITSACLSKPKAIPKPVRENEDEKAAQMTNQAVEAPLLSDRPSYSLNPV